MTEIQQIVIDNRENLLMKLRRKAYVTTSVCFNIDDTRKADLETLRLRRNNEYFYERHIGLAQILDHANGSREVRANTSFKTRKMTRETFEGLLRKAIDYFQKYHPHSRDYEYLRAVLTEHEATPYANAGGQE